MYVLNANRILHPFKASYIVMLIYSGLSADKDQVHSNTCSQS